MNTSILIGKPYQCHCTEEPKKKTKLLSGLLQTLTSPQHVLPLQQLHDGRLSGRDQDDASVFSAAHQAALWRDVHAGRHLATQTQQRCIQQEEGLERRLWGWFLQSPGKLRCGQVFSASPGFSQISPWFSPCSLTGSAGVSLVLLDSLHVLHVSAGFSICSP